MVIREKSKALGMCRSQNIQGKDPRSESKAWVMPELRSELRERKTTHMKQVEDWVLVRA